MAGEGPGDGTRRNAMKLCSRDTRLRDLTILTQGGSQKAWHRTQSMMAEALGMPIQEKIKFGGS